MIKFTTNKEWADCWRSLAEAAQEANQNYARQHNAQYFADKLEKAISETLKSPLFRDIDNGVRHD